MSDPTSIPPSASPAASDAPSPNPAARNSRLLALRLGGGLAVGALVAGALYVATRRAETPEPALDARVAATRAVQQTLLRAIQDFHAETGRFPVPPGFPAGEASPMRSDEVIKDALMGRDPIINPTNKSFLGAVPNAAETPAHPEGPGFSTASGRQTIVDAWGTEFFLMWDANGDGVITHPDPAANGASLPHPVLVFSAGPDGDADTWEDNVISWE